MAEKPLVLIVMGSDSDLPVMQEAVLVLEEFKIPYIMTITSAHRSPQATRQIIQEAEKSGVEIIIAGAGGAAHLAGVIAAETVLPVIGVAMMTPVMGGLDSLLSMVQMPAGVPVAVTGLGISGAVNAGVLAVQMLSKKQSSLKTSLESYKKKLAQKTMQKGEELNKLGYAKYIEQKFKYKK